jgi:hypothetical protein
MASRLGLPLFVSTVVLCLTWAQPPSTALAAGLDERGEAQAKEASQFYKQGHYEEAASIFAKLSVEYPDMAIFDRNLGACFYYLRKPDPALSNLRRYLSRKKNIGPDDKTVVDRWIDEMEKLRARVAGPEVAPAAPKESIAQPTVSLPARASGASETTPSLLPQPLVPSGVPARPAAGVDLSGSAASGESVPNSRRFYKTWWFWTSAAAVVVAGTVTAILLAGRSDGPCDNAGHWCVGVK